MAPLLLVVAPVLVASQVPFQLADVDSRPAGSQITALSGAGSRAYFGAFAPATGLELYTSNGSAAGTTLAADLTPGVASSTFSWTFTVSSTRAFIAANNQLYAYDTTGGVTVLAAATTDSFSALGANGTVFYFGRRAGTVTRLFRTDGTVAGTIELTNGQATTLQAGARFASPNGTFFFFFKDSRALWRTDGTNAGTTLVFDAGIAVVFPTPQLQVGPTLAYFNIGSSLYRTDGAPAGSLLLRTFTTLVQGGLVGNTLFFSASGTNGTELWRSDGTVGGTAEFMDLTPGPTSSVIPLFSSNGTRAFFLRAVTTPSAATELWATDGTTVGTVVLATMNDFSGASRLLSPALLSNGTVWASNGYETYASAGTAGSTFLVPVRTYAPLVAATGLFFFQTDLAGAGFELMASGGTPATTALTREIYAGTSSSLGPSLRTALSTDRSFLWMSGPSIIAGLDGRAGSMVRTLAAVIGPFGTVGTSCLASNTEPVLITVDAGFVSLGDVTPGGNTALRFPTASVDLGSATLFVAATFATTPPYDYELLRTDGTIGGTGRLLDLRPGPESSGIAAFERVGGSAYFNANDGVAGDEVWISDGTVMGTRRVADINPGVVGSSPSSFTAFRGGVVFVANDGTTGAEPWFSDGTAAGTLRLADTAAGSSGMTGFDGFCVAPALGAAYFVANGSMYETDGTPSGTRIVGAAADGFACAGDRVVALRDGGVEVFDGVATRRLPAPVASGTALDVVGVGTSAFMRATSPTTGTELWRMVDGGASLAALGDVASGTLNGLHPTRALETFRMRDRLAFFASTDGFDFEPWAFLLDGTPPVITPQVTGTTGLNGWYTSNVGVTFTVNEPQTRLATRNCQPVTVTTDTPGTTITCVAVSEGGESSASVTFKRDSTPPVAVVLTPPNGGSTNQRRPLLSVSSSEAAALTATSGATTWCTASGDAGTLGCTPGADLPVGMNTVSFSLVDPAGHTSAPVSTTFTIDVTAPSSPSFTSPPSGQRVRLLAFAGTAEANATVRVFEGGALLCTTTADASGAWTCTAPVTGAERTVIVTAEAQDPAGNVSARSPSLTVTLDLTAPAAPVISMPTANAQLGDARPTVSGTCEANARVSIFVDGNPAPDCQVNAPAGTFSCQLATALGNGMHSVSAVARDEAGNDSAPSNSVSFTVSTTVPTAPAITVPAAMAVLRDTRPTFSGTATASFGVRLFIDGAAMPACTATADGAGAWQCGVTIALSEGMHTATATARDSFGTDSPPSTAVAFTIDATPPAAPVITMPTPSSTTGLRPTILGTAELGTRVSVFLDGSGTATCTVQTTSAGAFTCALTAELAAGPHSAQAKAADPAGNESPLSGVVLFTAQSSIDTRAPTVVCPMNIEAQASASGSAIVNFQATVSDDIDLTPTLRYSQAPGTDFIEGDTTVLVTAQDASGNTAQCSFVVKVTASSERNTVRSGCRCSGVSADAFLSFAGALLVVARARRRRA